MGLKQRYRDWKIQKELATIKRTPVIRDFDSIKKVGIIWQPSEKKAFKYLHDYFNKKHIIIREFCIFDEDSNPTEGNNTLTTNDLDWWGIPKQEKIGEFIQMNFDVLLNISTKQNYVVDYVTALTYADLKIGWSPDDKNYFDLNINIGENRDALYLAKQQIFYLAQLNKNTSK